MFIASDHPVEAREQCQSVGGSRNLPAKFQEPVRFSEPVTFLDHQVCQERLDLHMNGPFRTGSLKGD